VLQDLSSQHFFQLKFFLKTLFCDVFCDVFCDGGKYSFIQVFN
jgi:hypothetical protein